MKRCKLIFKISFLAQAFSTPTAYPLARSRVNPGVLITLKRNLAGAAVGLLPLLILILSVAVPPEVSAFNWRNMIDDVKNKIENHIDDKAKEKGDAAEKKVEEGIDRALGEQSSTSQQGSAGQSVSQQQKATNVQAQQRLNSLGYDAGPVDGALGPRSVKAIKAFQRDHGMAETGQISPDLLAALQTAGTQPITVQQANNKPEPTPSTPAIDFDRLAPPTRGDLYRLAMAEHPDIYNNDSFLTYYTSYVDPPSREECTEVLAERNNPISVKKRVQRWQEKMQAAFKVAPSWPRQLILRFDNQVPSLIYDKTKKGVVIRIDRGTEVNWEHLQKYSGCGIEAIKSGQAGYNSVPDITHVDLPYETDRVGQHIDFFIPMEPDAAEQFIDQATGTPSNPMIVETAALVGPVVIASAEASVPVKVLSARIVRRKAISAGKWQNTFVYPIPAPPVGTQATAMATAGQQPSAAPSPQGTQSATGTTLSTTGQSDRMPVDSGPTLFTGFYNGLLGFKFLPELYFSDAVLSYLTQQQIRWESEEWDRIDSEKTKIDRVTGKVIGENPIPTFTFTWADTKNDARLKEIYIHHFLGKDLDWSFLKNYGYDPRKKSIVQLFLLQREKYRNRMPEFAAVELSPVYREFLETILPLIPTSYILRVPVQLKYDLHRQEMSFGTNEMMKELKRNFVFGEMPSKNRGGGMVFPRSLKGQKIYFSPPYNSVIPKTPTSMPGTHGGIYTESGPAALWRKDITSFDTTAPKVSTPGFLALDRELKPAPVQVSPSEAEKILRAQNESQLSTELHFEIIGAQPVYWFINGKLNSKFSVLLGKVRGLGIVDATNNEVLKVPLRTVQAIENEREEQQAEAEAQARQKKVDAQTIKHSLEDARVACWTGQASVFEEVRGCLDEVAKLPEATADWHFASAIQRDQKVLSAMGSALGHAVSQRCSMGALRAKSANSGSQNYSAQQQRQKACIEAVTLALKQEKNTCRAKEPRDKLFGQCMQHRAEVLVNKHYGLDGS